MANEKRQREQLRKNLITSLRKKKFTMSVNPKGAEVLESLLRFLAGSPAETVLVTLEDLWGEERSQNVPGTFTERPNWRRKAKRTIEEIRTDPELAKLLRNALRRRPF
jgi:4-alpha-glucanotransferase